MDSDPLRAIVSFDNIQGYTARDLITIAGFAAVPLIAGAIGRFPDLAIETNSVDERIFTTAIRFEARRCSNVRLTRAE